jgi:hypothetical protein
MLGRSLLSLSLAFTLLACGGGDDARVAPLAPDANDAAYTVSGLRNWYLVGNELTPGNDQLDLRVAVPAGTAEVELWIDGQGPLALTADGADFIGSFELTDVAAGERQLLLAADRAEIAFARLTMRRTHPLYVIVSNDWDDADNSDLVLTLQEELHADHPELKLTHFVGPYTFTDPTVSPERRIELVNWVKGLATREGDEIGLHIHPYCNFVDTTSVTCKDGPSTVYADGDPTGYTVQLGAYDEAEFTILLQASDQIFAANGLPKPTSFRAGGWTAELSTLKALAAVGYVADTSANNWARMEEWMGVENGVLYDWNKTQWATINDTSQPYYPSETDILVPGNPGIALLEVPDNGILVDYVTTSEMIQIFEANWSGQALTEPRAYSIGYHPSNFNSMYKMRIHGTLTRLDQHLASADAGPVVYAVLSDMPRVWKRP